MYKRYLWINIIVDSSYWFDMGSHPESPLLQSTSLIAEYSLKDHHYWEKYQTTVTLPNSVKS